MRQLTQIVSDPMSEISGNDESLTEVTKYTFGAIKMSLLYAIPMKGLSRESGNASFVRLSVVGSREAESSPSAQGSLGNDTA